MLSIDPNAELLDFCEPLTHAAMTEYLAILADRYGILTVSTLAQSILSRSIPLLRLGTGDKSILYVGAHHGSEWLTSVLLLRFVNDLCSCHAANKPSEGLLLSYLLSTRSIYILPMLNPDGVDLSINGAEDSLLRERQIRQNGGSTDFTHWQANARGVDLNHNYNVGFLSYKKWERENAITAGRTRYSGECPESEPESAALAALIRTLSPTLVLTLHTQGEEIYYGKREGSASHKLAEQLSRLSGYRTARAEGPAAYGGLTDWLSDELDIPACTLECGIGENPLPLSDYPAIYAGLRRALFIAPTLL
ncbi:MAG: M14 family metallocarboxypeptidase [Clostridia bacterium]|nr:M14 family metallocarboxypeptidase [Clostridia bacterium]